MTKINFYHLTKSPIDKALPKLLEKVLINNGRVVVVSENEEKNEELNKLLWTYTTKFFLPHGSDKDPLPARQPIYLTYNPNENPNGADILAFVAKAPDDGVSNYSKCLYMFDGLDQDQVSLARTRWKKYKNMGFALTYWQQNAKGLWEEKGA